MKSDVNVRYAKEAIDERHRSNGIRITFKDGTLFGCDYIEPVIEDNKMYFKEYTENQGVGKSLKLTPLNGVENKDKYSSRRIKRVSLDLDYIRQFAPFIGEHHIHYDYEKKLFFIEGNDLIDKSLPKYMTNIVAKTETRKENENMSDLARVEETEETVNVVPIKKAGRMKAKGECNFTITDKKLVKNIKAYCELNHITYSVFANKVFKLFFEDQRTQLELMSKEQLIEVIMQWRKQE